MSHDARSYSTPHSPHQTDLFTGTILSMFLLQLWRLRLRSWSVLDGEIFYSLKEAQVVIESWRRPYNTVRPHQSLGYRPPAPEVFVPALAAWPFPRLWTAPTATLPPTSSPGLN